VQLQTIKKQLLDVKTSLDFAFKNFDARGYITVTNGALFDLDDTVAGGTSSATGTVYAIDGNTLYLKDVTGTWQSGEVITDSVDSTSSTTSTLTTILFPYYITNKLVNYNYNLDNNANVGATNSLWIRMEARWDL